MTGESTSNIVIKPSALVGGLAAVLLAILGFMIKAEYNNNRDTDKKQWEIISELRQDVAMLKAKIN